MIIKRYMAAIAFSTALAVSMPAIVDAASVTTSTVTASAGDVSISSSKTTLSGDSIRFAQVLSTNYNRTIAAQDVMRLRADFDFGFGDISLIYATAVYSGHSVDEIRVLRQRNMGWGEIAKLYGVKVKDLKKGNYDVVNAARGSGVDITYIEIEDNDNDKYHDDHHNDNQDRDGDSRNDKKDYKKSDKHDEKHDNGKGHGNKK
jgi:hypothetical protein